MDPGAGWLEEDCEFNDERVYLLVAIARSKEHEGTSSGSQPVIRKIVEEERDLSRTVADLDHATSRSDARYRLYVSANARDTTAAFFELPDSMGDWLRMRLGGDEDVTRKFNRVDSEFKSVLQSDRCKPGTNVRFDLDDVSADVVPEFRARLEERTTVLLQTETPNRVYIVTEPFTYTEFETDVEYERTTDGLLFVSYIGT
jgi:hypothetical protein